MQRFSELIASRFCSYYKSFEIVLRFLRFSEPGNPGAPLRRRIIYTVNHAFLRNFPKFPKIMHFCEISRNFTKFREILRIRTPFRPRELAKAEFPRPRSTKSFFFSWKGGVGGVSCAHRGSRLLLANSLLPYKKIIRYLFFPPPHPITLPTEP